MENKELIKWGVLFGLYLALTQLIFDLPSVNITPERFESFLVWILIEVVRAGLGILAVMWVHDRFLVRQKEDFGERRGRR